MFLNISINLPLLAISYLLPLIVYSFDYYKDIDKDIQSDSLRAGYLKKKAKNYPYLLGIYVILLISLMIVFSNFSLISFIIAIVLGGISYNFLFKGLTKKIPAFKNVFTAMVWALGGAFFPLFYNSFDLTLAFIIMFVLIFIKAIINAIFFDLKDIDNDTSDGIKTLPVKMGKKTTINILHSLNIIAFIPLVMGIYLNIINHVAIALLIFLFYGYYYINKAKKASINELESTAHTLVDSEFILWALLLISVKFIICPYLAIIF